MAGYCPDLFEAIASFVPITDLEAWAGQNPYYTPHILACTESDPVEMAKRSPMSYLEGIARANVKIFHGKYDPSVPFTHSVNLFNAILAQNPTARVFLDIFDGGHDTDLHKTKCWFDSQYHHTKETAVSG
jgi:predicted esterase